VTTFSLDLRYGLRMLIKKPSFTVVAVLTLALGIGANTAIFSVVNAVLLRPLPYPESESLMWIGQQYSSGMMVAAGEPKFLFWRDNNQSFEAMAATQGLGGGCNLAGGDEAEYVDGVRVSVDFFRVLGVNPAIGRTFTQEEDTEGGDRVVIMSDGLWRRRFGADASLIGKPISLNGQSVTVVGVMPAKFQYLPHIDLFVPMRPSLTGDPNPNATVIARLKPGITLSQANEELKLIAEEYRAAHPRSMEQGESLGARPYQELFTSDVRQWLWILLGAVGFLLLIACANVANLQLTRATARRKEIAIRRALGAGGWRIVTQLLTEGVLLALVGGAAGLLLAVWGTDLLVAALPGQFLPRTQQVTFDWRVLAFAFSAAVVTGLLFGLAPAFQAARIDVNSALKEGAGKGVGGAQRGRLRNVFVVLELATSLVLLVGATLLVRTFANLSAVEPGFDAHDVLTVQVALNGERYDTTNEAAAFYHSAVERISNLPGVESAAVTSTLPLNAQFNMPVFFPGRPDATRAVQFRMITPEYFHVMRIPVKQGRAFTDADNTGAQAVAIVNEAFVHRNLSDADPATQQFSIGRDLGDPVRQIVGVVGDAKQFGLDSDAPPMVFVPIAQVPEKAMTIARRFVSSYFTVRASLAPQSLGAAIKREIGTLDAALPLSEIRPMEQVVARSIAPQRFNMLLIGVFAATGLLLATVGIYGVVSYSVAQRTNEIGIRIALGARAVDVARLILKQGVALTGLGVTIGLAASLALTRVMKSLLFGVSATDPWTFALITLLLAVVALMACYIPARRATKVDAMVALRYE
jgi:predicted permease